MSNTFSGTGLHGPVSPYTVVPGNHDKILTGAVDAGADHIVALGFLAISLLSLLINGVIGVCVTARQPERDTINRS